MDVERIVAVAVRTGRGEQPEDIATELGVDLYTVLEDLRVIVEALPDPRHQWESTAELRAALGARSK